MSPLDRKAGAVSVFESAGVFSTWGLSGDLPAERLVELCRDAGVVWIAGQFDDGENVQHLPDLRVACENTGIRFGIWDSKPSSYRLAEALKYAPTFWIAESEGNPTDWRNLVGGIPHHLERAVVTNFSGLDDECLVAAGFACLPECYLPENPNAKPDGMIEEAKRRGYDVVNCTLGVYWGFTLVAYQDVWPFSIWNAETMTEADWEELGQRITDWTTAPPEPEPEPAPEPTPDTDGEWWEEPYKGGPMVKVKGFPRPLYPPDAAEHGKKPSRDGPDVVAYKRTVSRAGRWPWQTFDDAYSNNFATGSGPNVIDTGVAGVQRQQHIDDTGWIGKATFNTLRSIRVPEGKPHAGEMAMDATAAKLIDEAFDLFGGHEPDDDEGMLRQAALKRAVGQLGYVESPSGSNHTKYGEWYGVDYQPWCAIFVTWCFEQEGDSPSFVRGSRYAYVPYVVGDARANRYGLKTTDDPMPGDLVCYDWSWDTVYDHIGIFEKWVDSNSFAAIEGNTSNADNSNGGQVMRRTRTLGQQGTVFVRVTEP